MLSKLSPEIIESKVNTKDCKNDKETSNEEKEYIETPKRHKRPHGLVGNLASFFLTEKDIWVHYFLWNHVVNKYDTLSFYWILLIASASKAAIFNLLILSHSASPGFVGIVFVTTISVRSEFCKFYKAFFENKPFNYYFSIYYI